MTIRTGARWRRVQAQVFTEEADCWLCGNWVDQSLPATESLGRTVDHMVQLCHGGDLLDRTWCRLAHRGCNTIRSNRLRGLTKDRCSCSRGLPCAVLATSGYLSVDVSAI